MEVSDDSDEGGQQLPALLAEDRVERGAGSIPLLAGARDPFDAHRSMLLSRDDRADLDGPPTRPGLRHIERFVEIGYVDLSVASDDLIALHEGPVSDERFPVRCESNRGGCVRPLQLVG